MRIFLIIPLLIAFLNVNAFAEYTKEVYKTDKLTIGKNTFISTVYGPSTGYCRGGNLKLNDKEIYSSVNQCILSMEKIDNDNILADICYGDGGGSGECIYIKANYSLKDDKWYFEKKFGALSYWDSKLEKLVKQDENSETKSRLESMKIYYHDSLLSFIYDFKYNADFSQLGNIYQKHFDKLSNDTKGKIDNIIEKKKKFIENNYLNLLDSIGKKLLSFEGKSGKDIDYKIGVYQYFLEKVYSIYN